MTTPQKSSSSASECIAPPALSDDILLGVLDGDEHSRQIDVHLEQCAYCMARLESMRMDEQTLLTMMYRADCPSADHIADYVMDSLTVSERAKIEQHLPQCSLCRQEVETLRAIIQVEDAQTGMVYAQELVWERLKDFFQNLEDQLVRILVPLPKTAYGQFKGSTTSGSRLLSYGNDALSIMLSLDKMIDGFKVNGDIIDTEGQGRWVGKFVELKRLDGKQESFAAVVDEDETFKFIGVPPGRFSLSVFVPTGEILRLQEIEFSQ